jgi:WD40 repeat protein
VAVSPDGRHVVSGSEDHTVAVWDLQTGERRAMLALDGSILSVTWQRSARGLIVGDAGGNLYCLEYREP